jgi:hypothetical protein
MLYFKLGDDSRSFGRHMPSFSHGIVVGGGSEYCSRCQSRNMSIHFDELVYNHSWCYGKPALLFIGRKLEELSSKSNSSSGDPQVRHLLQPSSESLQTSDSVKLLENLSSIDDGELLDSDLSDHVGKFFQDVKNVAWSRRTFLTRPIKVISGVVRSLVGLIPQGARVGDHVCYLYGRNFPVILRTVSHLEGSHYLYLIGEAYIEGIMDGRRNNCLSIKIRDQRNWIWDPKNAIHC